RCGPGSSRYPPIAIIWLRLDSIATVRLLQAPDAEQPIAGNLGLMKLTSTVLDSPDPRALATFYPRLLAGWTMNDAEDEWVTLRMPDGRPGLSFQYESKYARP